MASARLMKRQGPLRESDAAYVFKQAGETCCQRMYGNVRSILDVVCPSLESLKAFYTFYPWFSVLYGLFQITIVANRILVRLHQFLRPQWINCNMQCVWSKCRSVTVFSTCTTTGAFLRVRFWHFHKISSIFGLSSFQKGLSIATSSQRMSSLLGNLGIATLKSYVRLRCCSVQEQDQFSPLDIIGLYRREAH